MIKTCFLDMDGVIVDFVKGALELHGVEMPHDSVAWDMPKQLGIEPAAFWAPMGHDFWANLDWTPDGKELLAGIEDIFEQVVILTSPIDNPGAVEGKIEWIRRNMPAYTRRFFVGPPKDAIAGEGKLLLDDYDHNINAWRREGGVGVLVPRPWNPLGPTLNVPDLLDFVEWLAH